MIVLSHETIKNIRSVYEEMVQINEGKIADIMRLQVEVSETKRLIEAYRIVLNIKEPKNGS